MDRDVDHADEDNSSCKDPEEEKQKVIDKGEESKSSELRYEEKQEITESEEDENVNMPAETHILFADYVSEKKYKESEVSDNLEDIKISVSTKSSALLVDEVNDQSNQEKPQFCDQPRNIVDNSSSITECMEETNDVIEEKDHQESHFSDHSGSFMENESSIQAVEAMNKHVMLREDVNNEKADREYKLEKNTDNKPIKDVEEERGDYEVSSSQSSEIISVSGGNHGVFEATIEQRAASNEKFVGKLTLDEINVFDAEDLREKYIAEGNTVDAEDFQDKYTDSKAETSEKEKGEISIKEKSELAEEILHVPTSISADAFKYLMENEDEKTKIPVVSDLSFLRSSTMVNTDNEGNTNGEKKKQEQSQSVTILGEGNGYNEEKDTLTKTDLHETKQRMIESKLECGAEHMESPAVEVSVAMDKVCITGSRNEENFLDERAIATNTTASVYKSPSSTLPVKFNSPTNAGRLNLKDVQGKRKQGNKLKVEINNTLLPASTEGSSSVLQHGNDTDRDGGSSLDSTAGSGCKVKGSIGQIITEDANSSDGEDSATSPAFCIQQTQQRKKINIHHQFVREIVKIQHDREQYDKEQIERQMQAQQSANLTHVESKILENKEHMTNLQGKRHFRIDSQFVQKTQHSQSNETKLKQKQNVEIKRPSFLQTKRAPLQPDECSQIDTKTSTQGDDALRNRGSTRIERGKQRPMSIYRPPVARESAKGSQEPHNAMLADLSYHQNATHMNGSFDGSTASALDSSLPLLESLNLDTAEGGLKVVKSSSGERYVHYVESEAEASTPGMSIKVTFDTQKKMRHIEFSESSDVLDSVTDCKQSERISGGKLSSKSSENTGIGPHINRDSKTHIKQDSVMISSSSINKRQVGRFPKSNEQSNKVGWSENPLNVVIPDIGIEGKSAQADGVHQFSLSSHKVHSASLHFHNNASHSSQDTHILEEYHSDTKLPSSLLQGSSMQSSPNPSSVRKGQSFEQLYKNTLQSMDALHLSMDVQSAMKSLQSNTSGSKADSRGKQKLAGSGSGGKKKRESYSRTRESRSRTKDFEVPLGSPSYQVSGEIEEAQGLQPQPSSLQLKDNLFYSPILEKWGDIVDDLPDNYDLPKGKDEGEKEDHGREKVPGNKGAHVQDGIFQHNRPSPSPVAQESSSHTRKSVWERLGPHNDKGSILGPPPKILDNRMVHKPSSEVYRINTSTSVIGSLDTGFHGVPETSYHDAGSFPTEEGLEAVLQAYTGIKQKRSKRELYVPRRGV